MIKAPAVATLCLLRFGRAGIVAASPCTPTCMPHTPHSLMSEIAALRASDPALAARVEQYFERYYDLDGERPSRSVAAPSRAPGAQQATPGLGARLTWPTRDCHWASPNGTGDRSDVFIHKNLGAFLRGELHAFLGAHLASSIEATEESMALAREAIAVRHAAERLIDLLHHVEEERRSAWARPRLVVESFWCLTVDLLFDAGGVEHRLVTDIARNAAQREEWSGLLDEGDAPPPEGDVELWLAWLEAHPTLVIDTRYFSADFERAVLSRFEDLHSVTNGLLVHADNADGLRLLNARYGGEIQCVYIDPPFNTEGDGFAYRDRFSASAWLTMMDDRLALTVPLLTEDATLYAHVDYNEKERLRLLLDEHLEYITEIIWRIGWVSGFKSAAKKFVRNHDTIYQYGRTASPYFDKTYIPYPDGYTRRDGKAPTGPGYPLEDTWNCSELDPLHSIQIMSFSREKVGHPELTQKNENLLARMIRSSTRPGDTVLDYFLGSGTTAAAAHKLGRRWIGIERGEWLVDAALPRLKRVLAGDPYGISSETGWSGGGMFQYIRLAPEASPVMPAGTAPPLGTHPFETALLLLGLRARRRFAIEPDTGWTAAAAEGVLPDGALACVVHAVSDRPANEESLREWIAILPPWASDDPWIVYTNDAARDALPTHDKTVEVRSLDSDLHRLIYATNTPDSAEPDLQS